MSESGSAPGSSWVDERPLFNAGFVDTQGWAEGLRDYIATMKDRFPAEDHPSEGWLSKGFEMILLDQEWAVASAPKQGTSSVSGSKAVRTALAASSNRATMQRNLEVMTSGLANLELSSGPVQQSQWIKDRTFRVQAFSNKAAQFHAANLFDLESCALDLSQCVNGLTPYLAL